MPDLWYGIFSFDNCTIYYELMEIYIQPTVKVL